MDKTTCTTVDEYLAQFDGDIRAVLDKVRLTIQTNAPKAVEKISYRMPCYWQGGPLIYFAAMKNHLGIYPTSEGMVEFAEQLSAYKTSKGAVQFPWSKPIPYELIAQITRARARQAEV